MVKRKIITKTIDEQRKGVYATKCKDFPHSKSRCSQHGLQRENEDLLLNKLPNPKERWPKPALLCRSVMKNILVLTTNLLVKYSSIFPY